MSETQDTMVEAEIALEKLYRRSRKDMYSERLYTDLENEAVAEAKAQLQQLLVKERLDEASKAWKCSHAFSSVYEVSMSLANRRSFLESHLNKEKSV